MILIFQCSVHQLSPAEQVDVYTDWKYPVKIYFTSLIAKFIL